MSVFIDSMSKFRIHETGAKRMLTKKEIYGLLAGLTIAFIHPLSADTMPEISSLTVSNNQIKLEWVGGFSPYQTQSRTSLVDGVWTDLGNPTFSRSTLQGEAQEIAAFYRIIGSSAATDSAQYRLTFQSTWSAETHPTNFPSGSEHYSGLIGGTHNAGIAFWEPGTLATTGIKNVAEAGSTSQLTSEVNAAISAGTAEFVLAGGGLGSSPNSTTMTLDITQSHPLASVVTMIAPSPDWFVGVHGVNLFVDGDWVAEVSIPLFPYDAGTDDGTTYSSGNAASNPPQVIQQITGYPLAKDGSVASFGSFTFTRIDEP
jgi:hypothetical protein